MCGEIGPSEGLEVHVCVVANLPVIGLSKSYVLGFGMFKRLSIGFC